MDALTCYIVIADVSSLLCVSYSTRPSDIEVHGNDYIVTLFDFNQSEAVKPLTGFGYCAIIFPGPQHSRST